MEPFFFKSQGDNLFGVYHPAADVMSRKAIIICPPVYSEYFRTYRAIGKIAKGWARKGYHVLRFDYFGTGDSSGNWADGGPNRWLLDIQVAVTELLEISGSTEVTIAGVRLGASLGAMAANTNSAIKSLVIWDPIWSGADYLTSLQLTHEKLLRALRNISSTESQRIAKSELAGFALADWIYSELAELDLLRVDLSSVDEAKVVLSNSEFASQGFSRHCQSMGVKLHSQVFEADCDWTTHSESSLQAPEIVNGVEACL